MTTSRGILNNPLCKGAEERSCLRCPQPRMPARSYCKDCFRVIQAESKRRERARKVER